MDKVTGCLTIIVLLIVIVIGCFSWFTKHISGNKQIIDFNHQKFNVAYIMGNSNTWEKVHIKAWKDWENSDAVQIITEDGNAIYTHLMNVKLMEK